MIMIITALQKESSPLIQHFRLKKDMQSHAFPVYRNDTVTLAVAGVGKLRAAVATAYLLSQSSSPSETILLCNVGLCGSRFPELHPGSICAVHKVTDADTGRDYYPDSALSLDKNIPVAALLCVPRPIRTVSDSFFEKYPDALLCDMESAGIMDASARFLQTHQVLILKVVSDFMSPDIISNQTVENYLQMNTSLLASMIERIHEELCVSGHLPEANYLPLIESICKRFLCTSQMNKILTSAVRRSVLSGKNPASMLTPFLRADASDKRERRQIFDQILLSLERDSVPGNLR
jgi:nucleoside phosphorylase